MSAWPPFDPDAVPPEEDGQHAHYVLRLYVTGTTRHSLRAVVNIRRICEEYLHGRYELEIVDITRDPLLTAREQVVAAPTLIRTLPLPLRRFIGDLSQTDRILHGLDVRLVPPPPAVTEG